MFNKKKNNDKEENIMNPENTSENTAENVENTDAPIAEAEQAPELSAEEKLQAEVQQLNDKYLRLYAEFDNYKRRTQKERVELLQTAGKDVIVSLLPVLDDFDRALKAMETAADVAPVKEGILLVSTKLKNTLAQKGLKDVESISQPFNTDFHEAITNIPAPSDDLKGKVIDEVEKGYTLNDNVIRFAKVVVGA
ncbi:nucleotide exchange factor GrpE [Pedobacter sp. ISL-68]|jgi:molecular chaperone GrpE|uniref:nucleotide exchange factor GrpE n=1 Tax=unclassified Pedobacter TaxID=2628915 RepID=UPI001BE5E9C8|nr:MULTISPECIES: nucleotide exchange factor GrpE [unclassified Pedobacter]MBT2564043.1 nucleotide exchange factor GrpE [Pedobacter sp. ISL-64]MBT2589823.1 nucleotide exchange factor GrpE [Pedobacter sp. ISL-68]CAH0152697.1 Protein GrpE [Pedobacter sp. Bi126]CAH0153105.1 Protein GrpE [Pedobacter sp. Bi27]CAH0205630.1 Protein GrpE [Pedobacter sp. Bi36]